MTDHYSTLGLSRTATADDIKRAYRRLASQHHPDKGGDTAKFQEIQAAYDVLGDPAKRAQYDSPQPQFNFGQDGHQFRDINDIFSQMFGGGFPGQGQRRPQPFVRMSLWIKLTDVITGGRRPVSVNTGSGSSTIEIEIPRGINDGDSVQYPRLAPGGADLVVQFRVHPDPRWQREGLNLTTEKDVDIWDMILGGDLPVTTIAGEQLIVTVPPRCQARSLLRIRGRGIPDNHGKQGDLFVRVNSRIPDYIDPDLLQAIQQYRR
jgi:DnaJ-class molecular chaperone